MVAAMKTLSGTSSTADKPAQRTAGTEPTFIETTFGKVKVGKRFKFKKVCSFVKSGKTQAKDDCGHTYGFKQSDIVETLA